MSRVGRSDCVESFNLNEVFVEVFDDGGIVDEFGKFFDRGSDVGNDDC
jgi:hypothetical protein